jgi:hypothetical protein
MADRRLRVVGLVMLPAAVVAPLLVPYFDWRGQLGRRLHAERHGGVDLDKSA